ECAQKLPSCQLTGDQKRCQLRWSLRSSNDHPCPTLTRSVCVWGCLGSLRTKWLRLLECGSPHTSERKAKNQEKSMRTRIGLNRVIRCCRSRRFLLPLGVLAVAAVA